MLGLEKWITMAVMVLIMATLGFAVGSFVMTAGVGKLAYDEVVSVSEVGGVNPMEWLSVFHDTINFPVGKFMSVGAFLASVVNGFIAMMTAYWCWRLWRTILST